MWHFTLTFTAPPKHQHQTFHFPAFFVHASSHQHRGREILRVLLRDEGVPVFATTHDALSYCACLLRQQHQQQQMLMEGVSHNDCRPVSRLLSQVATVLDMSTESSRGRDGDDNGGGEMRVPDTPQLTRKVGGGW